MTKTATIVRGDLLSCYTASIAGYWAAIGGDADALFSCQWFVGVRPRNDPRETEVRHYHTSLLGDQDANRIQLRPARALDAATAHASIASEVARHGAAIVQGDTALLPWLVTAGGRSAPHWLVVDGVDDSNRLHVVDRFEWNDPAGYQTGQVAWIAIDQMDCLRYQPALERDKKFRIRERLAFGEAMEVPPAPSGNTPTWRWFERTDSSLGHGPDAPQELAERLLARSCGAKPVKLYDGELMGGSGILSLADVLDRTLDSAAAYALSNDLWVLGRTRRHFVERLAESRGWGITTGTESIADGLGREIASRWDAVARLMHYNEAVVQLGRAPRRGVVQLLRELARLEDDFVGHLRQLVEREASWLKC